MRDHAYDRVPFRLSEMEHRYGPNVHIVAQPYLLSQLATACTKGTIQPQMNRLVASLYADLVKLVLAAEFPRRTASIPTRMIDLTERGVFHGEVLDPSVRAITVSIARAGTLPSQVCFDLLNEVLDPRLVRQDHFVMARIVDEQQHVTGAAVHGVKIGGDVDEAFLLFPDPMGATGSSLSRALRTYKDEIKGTPRRILCLHLVITPEYIRRMSVDHPEAVVYALRLDRGMSPPEVMGTVPGTHPELERGLDDHQYIVPGAGGLGELMNNAYV